jgi:hypothetical protein
MSKQKEQNYTKKLSICMQNGRFAIIPPFRNCAAGHRQLPLVRMAAVLGLKPVCLSHSPRRAKIVFLSLLVFEYPIHRASSLSALVCRIISL